MPTDSEIQERIIAWANCDFKTRSVTEALNWTDAEWEEYLASGSIPDRALPSRLEAYKSEYLRTYDGLVLARDTEWLIELMNSDDLIAHVDSCLLRKLVGALIHSSGHMESTSCNEPACGLYNGNGLGYSETVMPNHK